MCVCVCVNNSELSVVPLTQAHQLQIVQKFCFEQEGHQENQEATQGAEKEAALDAQQHVDQGDEQQQGDKKKMKKKMKKHKHGHQTHQQYNYYPINPAQSVIPLALPTYEAFLHSILQLNSCGPEQEGRQPRK